ncbi:periplasmic heavy metal sensor [Silvibacterium sp.]|uniref:periplasmic heavy metal sensor n=1 Tax=Silvibacterium sp. TaxID=1964179 RepID=UPI0039E65ACE
MHRRWLKVISLSLCLLAGAAVAAHAQAGGPGGPGGGPRGPGGGVPGGPSSPTPPAAPSSSSKVNGNATTGGGVQFGPPRRWWDDKSAIKSVGISGEQKKNMDAIFDANKPAILESYQKLLKEQAKLTAISKDSHADKASLFAEIDAVNQARSALQKTVAQMYLQIRQQMDARQIEKLESLQ